MEDIKLSATLLCTSGAVDDPVEAYNSGVKFLINKHAPLQRKTITPRPNTSWYAEELLEGKHNRRKAERLRRKTNLEIHHRRSRKASHEIQEDLLFRQDRGMWEQ